MALQRSGVRPSLPPPILKATVLVALFLLPSKAWVLLTLLFYPPFLSRGYFMKKYIFTVFILFFCLGVGYLFWAKSAHHSAFIQPNKKPLPTQILGEQNFTYTKSFIGSVQAIQSVDVVPYLSGYLKEVFVNAGQEVQKGEILFTLDQRIPLAELNQAQEAANQAEATRANALTFYERMEKTESKAISSTELEQAKTEFQAADAAYQKALANQNQAQTMYDYTTIIAPIDGWVGNVTATIGEYLSPMGKTLATIIAFSPIRLAFSVPMATYQQNFDLNKATLRVLLAGGKNVQFQNFKVIQDNRVDKTTDSVLFFVDVPNKNKMLVPDAYIEVEFLFAEKGILVDKNWVSLTPDGAMAYVLADGIIQKRSVQIGAPIDNQYWIQSGLSPGDEIITVPVMSDQVGQSAQGVHS